jgi:hypothetical protein
MNHAAITLFSQLIAGLRISRLRAAQTDWSNWAKEKPRQLGCRGSFA